MKPTTWLAYVESPFQALTAAHFFYNSGSLEGVDVQLVAKVPASDRARVIGIFNSRFSGGSSILILDSPQVLTGRSRFLHYFSQSRLLLRLIWVVLKYLLLDPRVSSRSVVVGNLISGWGVLILALRAFWRRVVLVDDGTATLSLIEVVSTSGSGNRLVLGMNYWHRLLIRLLQYEAFTFFVEVPHSIRKLTFIPNTSFSSSNFKKMRSNQVWICGSPLYRLGDWNAAIYWELVEQIALYFQRSGGEIFYLPHRSEKFDSTQLSTMRVQINEKANYESFENACETEPTWPKQVISFPSTVAFLATKLLPGTSIHVINPPARIWETFGRLDETTLIIEAARSIDTKVSVIEPDDYEGEMSSNEIS